MKQEGISLNKIKIVKNEDITTFENIKYIDEKGEL